MKHGDPAPGDGADDQRENRQEREAPALPFAFGRRLSISKSFAALGFDGQMGESEL